MPKESGVTKKAALSEFEVALVTARRISEVYRWETLGIQLLVGQFNWRHGGLWSAQYECRQTGFPLCRGLSKKLVAVRRGNSASSQNLQEVLLDNSRKES